MKQSTKILITFLIFLITLIDVSADNDYFTQKSLLINLELESKIDIIKDTPDSRIEYINAQLNFFPRSTWRQEIKSMSTKPESIDEREFYTFHWDEPKQDTLTITHSSKGTYFYSRRPVNTKINFPYINIDDEYKIYTNPTEKIDIDENIIRTASELAEGEDDLYKVVFKLANWTNHNIEYRLDDQTSNDNKESTWVMKNRIGVCDEITNLFISLCRALKIPARPVSGISYSNSDLFSTEWGMHGWAEVYFGEYGWIPFDVTYGEFGYIDATHIALWKGIDSDTSSTKYEWSSSGAEIKTSKLNFNIDMTSTGKQITDPIKINSILFEDSIGFGSYNILIAELENTKDYYVTTDIIAASTPEVTIYDNARKILLSPLEKRNEYFMIKIPDSLKKNYIYTFPISITNTLNTSSYIELNSDKGSSTYDLQDIKDILDAINIPETKKYSNKINMECDIPETIIANKSFIIKCSISNQGNLEVNNLNICLKNDCHLIDLDIMQERNLDFEKTIESIGTQNLIITAKNEDISNGITLKAKIYDNPKINISDLKYPKSVSYDDPFEVSFTLHKKSTSIPKNLTVRFKTNFDNKEFTFDTLDLDKPITIKMHGNSLTIDDNPFSISTTYYGLNGERYDINTDFSILLDEPTFIQRIKIFLSKIDNTLSTLFK